ncbi:nucleoside/nucleotide kinase family protein [uncultured Sulfitobacter sp.]|uniref:nucleoside/nucleotide kinase family protein n=1 Tax=uncultured Sulfitobacter sp. TaxID=191468 RepID=UPI002624EF01|nr:nucleoside/nucleotide kinase family protein [uncultured Sulfitobacter sp.]
MLLPDILARIAELAHAGQRVIIAVSGPAGSGKSTVAETLANELGSAAAVVPMDGFHLDNSVLQDRGLLRRKGAPETFDADGFVTLIRRLNAQDEVVIPVFDRKLDIAIAGARVIDASHRILLVEGSYLLLDHPPWSQLAPLWDLTIALDVPIDVLEQRLTNRWLAHDHTPEQAKERALANDIPNAQYVISRSRPAQITVKNES